MRKEIADMWIAALRSGRFEQGKGSLRCGDAFCCLGVLCDLHSKAESGNWNDSNYRGRADETVGVAVPPSSVVRWAGLSDFNPRSTEPGDFGGLTLAELNDGLCGADGFTFSKIADVVERDWEKL